MQVSKLSLSNNPVTSMNLDGKDVEFYRFTISRNKDNKELFVNPPRDSGKLIKDATGKFLNFEVCSHEGETINNTNIHNIINSGTIHFGEFDLSSMSSSSMGLSAKAKFSKNKHFIVYVPKKSNADVSGMINQDELNALARINANNSASASVSSGGSAEHVNYDNDNDNDIDVDISALELEM